MPWIWVAIVVGVLAAIAVVRPWRFFCVRSHCPQCRQVLARWGRWGWKEEWSCPRCGCQVGR